MKVIVDSAIPFIRGVFEPWAEVVYCGGSAITNEVVRDADALIVRTRTQCNRKLLDGSRVKFIATATIGRDHIDEKYCEEVGIAVVSAVGCNARGVLQWVAAALKYLLVAEGGSPEDYTLGVVGVGNVGSLVAQYARHWGFKVLECDPPRQEREGGDFVLIDEIARRADIITLHTPLNESTHHLVDARLLNMMRSNAVIINASRGAVVDNAAIARSSHRYMFDVWENEPILDGTVLANAVLATPHIAGYSLQGKANATAMVVNAVASHFGLPLSAWYPADITPSTPKLISWEQMCATIDDNYSILNDTAKLKSSPDDFESLRNSYNYREEYF